jgi:uncharacterized protein
MSIVMNLPNNNIPIFPNFKRLKSSDALLVNSIANQYEPYSDFNFISMWGYCHTQCQLSYLQDNIIAILTDYKDQSQLLTFIGNKPSPEFVLKVISYGKEKKISDELNLIPEVALPDISELAILGLTVTEDVDNHDYVVDMGLASKMIGGFYNNKRHELNRFNRMHDSFYITKNLLSESDRKSDSEEITIFSEWLNKKADPQNWLHEFDAMKRVLALKPPDTYSYVLHIDDKPAGFCIIELLVSGFAMLHYWKTTASTQHGYTYLLNHISNDLVNKGYQYINLQQDLGIPELREAKKRWHPVKMLKKYTIS